MGIVKKGPSGIGNKYFFFEWPKKQQIARDGCLEGGDSIAGKHLMSRGVWAGLANWSLPNDLMQLTHLHALSHLGSGNFCIANIMGKIAKLAF